MPAPKPTGGVLIFRFNYEKKEGIVMRQIVAACWTAKGTRGVRAWVAEGERKAARVRRVISRPNGRLESRFSGCLLRESYCYWRHEQRFAWGRLLPGRVRVSVAPLKLTIRGAPCN